MKNANSLKAIAAAALLVVGTSGAALAQDRLVSGEPYPGFFEGVTVEANGPVIQEWRATEAPSRLVKVEGRSILIGELSVGELAATQPEALISSGTFTIESGATAFAQAD